jgi:hypothetical protein
MLRSTLGLPFQIQKVGYSRSRCRKGASRRHHLCAREPSTGRLSRKSYQEDIEKCKRSLVPWAPPLSSANPLLSAVPWPALGPCHDSCPSSSSPCWWASPAHRTARTRANSQGILSATMADPDLCIRGAASAPTASIAVFECRRRRRRCRRRCCVCACASEGVLKAACACVCVLRHMRAHKRIGMQILTHASVCVQHLGHAAGGRQARDGSARLERPGGLRDSSLLRSERT